MFQRFLLPYALFGSVALLSAPNLSTLPPQPVDLFSRAVVQLDGIPVSPLSFPATNEGFDEYLKACGVSAISAVSLTTPNHPRIASRLGYSHFLPERKWWPRGAALALLAQQLQTVAAEPVAVRNWWRPPKYNSHPAVAGAKYGDHPTANAVDLDYQTVAGRMRAERWLRALDKNAPWLELSLGLGPRTIHVGMGSPRGRREWHYAGWRSAS
jgi:hypothetical protein